MKHNRRILLCTSSLALLLASCGGTSSSLSSAPSTTSNSSQSSSQSTSQSSRSSLDTAKWNLTEQDFNSAVNLNVAISKSQTFSLGITYPSDIFLPTITRNDILVYPKSQDANASFIDRVASSNIDSYEFTYHDRRSVTLKFPSLDEGVYYVLFAKEAIEASKYAIATVFTASNDLSTPYFSLEQNQQYRMGEKNPSFAFDFSNASLGDSTLVEFGKGLSELTTDKIVTEEGKLTLSTKGTIANEETGTITLKKGFFANIDYDTTFSVALSSQQYQIDQRSFAFDDGVFLFDLYLESSHVGLTQSDIKIENKKDLAIASLTALETAGGYRIGVQMEATNLSDALSSMQGATLVVSGALSIPFNVSYPGLSLNPVYDGKTLQMRGTLSNCTFGFNDDDLVYSDSNLVLEGDEANATFQDLKSEGNTFVATYSIQDAPSDLHGTLQIDKAKIETLWGEEYELRQGFDVNMEIEGGEGEGEYIQPFDPISLIPITPEQQTKNDMEALLNANLVKDNSSEAANIAVLFFKIHFAIYGKNAVSAVDNMMSLFGAFGIIDLGPTIQDVLNRLETMDHKLDAVSEKISYLTDQVSSGNAAINAGIDKILFNQYQSSWDAFTHNYIEPMEDIIRSFKVRVQNALVKTALSSSPTNVEVCYANIDAGEGEKRSVVIENPAIPGYSTEYAEIKERHKLSIPASYFAEAKQIFIKSRGYSTEFSHSYLAALEQYLEDHPNSALYAQDILSAILGQSQFEAINGEEATKFYNLYNNFATALPSKVQDYFRMLECFYNFQTEAEEDLLSIRASMKKLLVKYVGFVSLFSSFASNFGIEQSEINKVTALAENFLRDNNRLVHIPDHSNYSYVTHSLVQAHYAEINYSIGFKSKGNHGSMETKLTYRLRDPWANGGDYKDVDSITNMLTQDDLLHIKYRMQNMYTYFGSQAPTFTDYLETKGKLISPQYVKELYASISEKKEEPGDYPPIITQIGKVASTTEKNWLAHCLDSATGKYLQVGGHYPYGFSGGDVVSSAWGALDLQGQILDAEQLTVTDEIIDRVAWYHDSHSYWVNDEWFVFTQYTQGRHGLVFCKA